MSEKPPRLWTVHLNREEHLVFLHVSARSEDEAIEVAIERFEGTDDYSLEDSDLIAASAEPEEE